jgi:hypothetical protein
MSWVPVPISTARKVGGGLGEKCEQQLATSC